jgi:hypothetical protein
VEGKIPPRFGGSKWIRPIQARSCRRSALGAELAGMTNSWQRCSETGISNVDAARAVGISERTVRRRLDDPAYVDRVREARSDAVERASGALVALMNEAVGTLESLLNSTNDSVRIRAAQAVLQYGRGAVHMDQLERRLAKLTELLEPNSETP